MGLIERIAGHARWRGDATALAHARGDLSYRALHALVTDLAAQWRAQDLRTLALDLDNGPAFAACDLAACAAGVAALPLPPFFSPGQFRHALSVARADAVVTDHPERLRARVPDLPVRAEGELVVAGRPLQLLRLAPGPGAPAPGIAKITFTSGTTGTPRGVLLGRAQIESVTVALAEATAAGPDDRCLALAPLAVLLENVGSLYVPLWAGATAVLPPLAETGLAGAAGMDAERLHRALHSARATGAVFSPQTLLGLVRVLERGAAPLPELRFAAVGGAVSPPTLLERARRLGLPVFEGYGLSECGSVVTLNTPRASRAGSVGRPLPHVRVRVADDGEIEVAAGRFAGYLGDSADRDEGDWQRTGDLGRMDADGFLYLTGRRRNVLITAFGRNVAPEWVESELTLEPAIAQAAVFGEARPWLTALLVPAPGADRRTLAEAVARANARLPDYARVRRWRVAPEPFTPANGMLTGTGRVRRDALRARHETLIESGYEERKAS